MGYIERLTKRVEPYTVTLQSDWQARFSPTHKADSELSNELLMNIEGWLIWHIVCVKMQRETLVAAKSVKKAITKVADRISHSNYNATPDASLEKLLKYRDEEGGITARAHNVALDWIACGLPTARSAFSSSNKPDPGNIEKYLIAALKCELGLSLLKASIAGQQLHFSLDPAGQRQRLMKLEGCQMSNGNIFTFKLDPRQRSHARPEQAARDILAAALRDIYKCTGFSPHVPRDGSHTSPFLRFLEAARLSLPPGYQSELVSPARRVEIDEKMHGSGTLERFKAKLYHPDCWRTQPG